MDNLLSEHDLHLEIQQLRQTQLRMLALFAPLMGWIWFYCAISGGNGDMSLGMPIIAVCIAAYAAHRLATSHYRLACWILVIAIGVPASLYARGQLGAPSLVVCTLCIIITHALLGGAAAATMAIASMIVVGWRWHDASSWIAVLLPLAGIYAVSLMAAWLINKPLTQTADLALTGWAHARNAVLRMREQRGELHRAVRGLDEANYRIERANQELVIAQQAAESAREVKARFAATVSHELRGPLNLILGFSRLMCLSPEDYDEPLPASYRADMYTIYRSCRHLTALVDDILDLSQLEAQHLPLVKDRIDVEMDVVYKAVDIVRPLAERKGLTVQYRPAHDLPWLLADAVRLRQALLNVLLNAVRFTDHGGITISTRLTDSHLTVSVSDTGRGIAEEDLPTLFREFTQVHAQDGSEAHGSGLGLAISKQLIELHGGTMWANSHVGKGTTIALSLPLPSVDLRAPDVISTGQAQSHHYDAVCVVVHDDADIVRLLARYLSEYTVVGLPSPDALDTILGQLRPGAIIASEGASVEVNRRIAELELNIPVITCDLPTMAMRDLIPSIVGYLVKPIKREVLTAALTDLPIQGEYRVLIADDDPETVRLLERMLTALPLPYSVRKAYDGAQALDMLRNERPDLFLVDLVMPTLEGHRVLEMMQADEQLRGIRTIVVSGRDWIDEEVTLGRSIKMWFPNPAPLSVGIRCLKSLVSALHDGIYPDSAADELS